jgi:hypothetical protein
MRDLLVLLESAFLSELSDHLRNRDALLPDCIVASGVTKFLMFVTLFLILHLNSDEILSSLLPVLLVSHLFVIKQRRKHLHLICHPLQLEIEFRLTERVILLIHELLGILRFVPVIFVLPLIPQICLLIEHRHIVIRHGQQDLMVARLQLLGCLVLHETYTLTLEYRSLGVVHAQTRRRFLVLE